MKIYMEAYKGLNAVTIENELIRLVVLPELGAKIASLLYKPQNFEVLFQPSHGRFCLSRYGASFAEYDTAGADEMYPTIDACVYPYSGYTGAELPDHGELWSIPWQIGVLGEQLIAQVAGRSLPYSFKRVLDLGDNKVRMQYQVTNNGDKPLYGIWAFHGLVACDEHTQIILPETDTVINVHNSTLLGSAGTKHSFPLIIDQAGQDYPVNRIRPRSANDTEKFYVEGRVKRGQAALTLNNNRLLYQLVFPKEQVPYLGVWINQGGFKGEYNCALEPATGFYDSLEIAQRLGTVEPIAPGSTLEWYLNINLEALP